MKHFRPFIISGPSRIPFDPCRCPSLTWSTTARRPTSISGSPRSSGRTRVRRRWSWWRCRCPRRDPCRRCSTWHGSTSSPRTCPRSCSYGATRIQFWPSTRNP